MLNTSKLHMTQGMGNEPTPTWKKLRGENQQAENCLIKIIYSRSFDKMLSERTKTLGN